MPSTQHGTDFFDKILLLSVNFGWVFFYALGTKIFAQRHVYSRSIKEHQELNEQNSFMIEDKIINRLIIYLKGCNISQHMFEQNQEKIMKMIMN